MLACSRRTIGSAAKLRRSETNSARGQTRFSTYVRIAVLACTSLVLLLGKTANAATLCDHPETRKTLTRAIEQQYLAHAAKLDTDTVLHREITSGALCSVSYTLEKTAADVIPEPTPAYSNTLGYMMALGLVKSQGREMPPLRASYRVNRAGEGRFLVTILPNQL